MADPNEAVFNIARETMVQNVVRTAGGAADAFRLRVIRFVSQYMADFYTELVTENVGYEAPSALMQGSSYYTDWKPLSPDYFYRKGAKNAFYDYSGELREHLLGRSALADFGKPKVEFKTSGSGLSDLVFIDSAGKAQYKKGSGGRGYAPTAVAFSKLKFEILVEMFPRAQGKTMRKVFNKFPKTGNIRYKMAVNEFGRSSMKGKAVNHPARPLLRPFLDWYGTTNLRLTMTEQLGVGI